MYVYIHFYIYTNGIRIFFVFFSLYFYLSSLKTEKLFPFCFLLEHDYSEGMKIGYQI